MEQTRIRGFTQNQLKIIAVITMVVDHVGVELFPGVQILRIIGRLAFPIFSFFVYEGFRYTRNKLRYLTQMLLLGSLCVAVYFFYTGKIYGNVLITFSLSICILSGVQFFRERLNGDWKDKALGTAVMLLCFAGAYLLCAAVTIDYGFWGVMLPAFAALADGHRKTDGANRYLALLSFGTGLLILSIQMRWVQIYSLLALPLLAFYNGRRGKLRMKAFFYWFYPVHLLMIELIAFLIRQ